MTPALSSKYINTPSLLLKGFRCRMTTAGMTFFLSSGLPFFTVATNMSPEPAAGSLFRRPEKKKSGDENRGNHEPFSQPLLASRIQLRNQFSLILRYSLLSSKDELHKFSFSLFVKVCSHLSLKKKKKKLCHVYWEHSFK